MSISSDLEQVHEDIVATPESCVAELSNILGDITTNSSLPQPVSFPSHLFDATFPTKATVSSHNSGRLILALDKIRGQVHEVLHRDSVLLLVYALLNLGDKTGQETGLLLLDESGHQTETHTEPFKGKLLQFSDHPSSIRYKTITILYAIFLDKARTIQCRRMAGKLLVESMVECKDTGIPIPVLQDLSSYCPRTVSVVRHETDIVLRFFAGFIIRILHLSGTNEDLLWSNCDDHCRAKSFECLRNFPVDWIESFQLYVGEPDRHESKSPRANSRRNDRSGNTMVNSCCLIRSITIGSQSYTRHFILASLTPNNLIFILPVKEAAWTYFQYIEIPVQYISQSRQCAVKHMGEQKHALRLTLDSIGSMVINGKDRALNGSNIYITSDKDLRELCDALRECKKRAQMEGRVTRRISSTIMALDNGTEVARKSINHCKSLSQVSDQVCPLIAKSHSSDDNQKPELSGHPTDEVHTMPGLAQEPPDMDDSLPIISRDTATSDDASERTRERVSPDREALLGPGDEDVEAPEKASSIAANTHILGEAGLYESDIPAAKDLMRNANAEANPTDDDTGPKTTTAAPTTLQRRRSGRSSTRGRVTQKSPTRRSKIGRASINRKCRSTLANTQESLLFPPRRSNRKVYTSHSKAAVDWEEDLRPTEEDEEGYSEAQKDLDVTSVSSASPGVTSTFNRKPNTAQKKRITRPAPSAIKSKKLAKRNRAAVDRNNKKAAQLPLHTKETNTDRNNLETVSSCETRKGTMNTDVGIKLYNCASIRPRVSNKKESTTELASHSTRSNNATPPVRESQISFWDKQNRDPSVEISDKQGGLANDVKDDNQESKPRSGGTSSEMKVKLDVQEKGLEGKDPVSVNREIMVSQDRCSLSEDHDIHLYPGYEEQISLTRCASAPGAQVPNESPNLNETLDQDAGSLNSQAVSKSNEGLDLLPTSAEKRHTPDTSAEAATVEGIKKDSQRSIPEANHSAPGSKKRASLQDSTSEGQSKKVRTSVSPTLGHQTLHQAGDITAENSGCNQGKNTGNDDISMEKPKALKRSTITTGIGESLNLFLTTPPPKPRAIGVERSLSPFHLSSQANLSLLSTSSPKKRIVDENGSPRLVSGHDDNLDFTRRNFRSCMLEYWDEYASSQSEYDGDHDDADSTDYSISARSSTSTSQETHAIASETNESRIHTASALSNDTDEVGEKEFSNMGRRTPITERLRRCTKRPNLPVETIITPYSIFGSPRKANSPEVQDAVLQPSPSVTPARLQPGVTQSNRYIEGADSQLYLETIQKATQDKLLSTNECLTRQLEGEKDTISQVLDSYRQGCHQVLDQLFKVHEERIELYRQQMASVRQQHKDLCQDLIRRFEENDKQIQERLSIVI